MSYQNQYKNQMVKDKIHPFSEQIVPMYSQIKSQWEKIVTSQINRRISKQNEITAQIITGKILHSLILQDFIDITKQNDQLFPPDIMNIIINILQWDRNTDLFRNCFEKVSKTAYDEDEFHKLDSDIQNFLGPDYKIKKQVQQNIFNFHETPQDNSKEKQISNDQIQSSLNRFLQTKFNMNSKQFLYNIDPKLSNGGLRVFQVFWCQYLKELILGTIKYNQLIFNDKLRIIDSLFIENANSVFRNQIRKFIYDVSGIHGY